MGAIIFRQLSIKSYVGGKVFIVGTSSIIPVVIPATDDLKTFRNIGKF